MFIGEQPKGKPQVAHWDGEASNNNLVNLRWASAAENSQDSIRLGRSGRLGGIKHARSKFSKDDLSVIFKMHADKVSARKIAIVFSSNHGSITEILKGNSYIQETKEMGLL
jgi:hypothetical protein